MSVVGSASDGASEVCNIGPQLLLIVSLWLSLINFSCFTL